jgi:hypothetical protein
MRLFGDGSDSLVRFVNEMETKRSVWKLNLPHFVEPSSGSWIPRSQRFKDSDIMLSLWLAMEEL